MQMKPLFFLEETLRDGQQSLWANRMTTASMLPAAPMMDKVGFKKINTLSASAFEVCIMYLLEDPWERLRLLNRFMPNTPLNYLIRSRNLMGWQIFPNDVVELFFRCLKKIGIKWIMVFDGLNDMKNLAWHFYIGKEIGLKVTGILVFAESPVHTDEYFAEKAKEIVSMGVDTVCFYDASGLLTPERTWSVIKALRGVIGPDMELEFISHCGTGLGKDCYLQALKGGVDAIATASLPLAYGNSIPSTAEMAFHAREMGFHVDLNDQLIREIDDYFFWVAHQLKRPVGRKVKFDPTAYRKYAEHQIPGGMMSHLVSQLKDLGLENRLPAVLEEAGRVREEIGYPVMVTPFSQFVGVQAVFNVMEGERYRTVPYELRLYARGHYGQLAAPIEPNVLDRILAGGESAPIDPTERFHEPMVSEIRAEHGPFGSDEELLMTLFATPVTLEKFYRNRKTVEPEAISRIPLTALIRELSKRRGVERLSIEKGTLKLTQCF
jgi:oxaloacetate decarboxylase alpha subunit